MENFKAFLWNFSSNTNPEIERSDICTFWILIFINCFSQIFVHALFSLYATDQNAAVRRLKNIRAFEAVAPHMYSELRRPEHICDKFETESPKKISFYWQQVGFDSVCSQQRPRLDVLAHFFKKKKIYKSIEKNQFHHGKFKFIKKF